MNETSTHDALVRRAAPGDVAAVVSVWSAGWRETHLGHVPHELIEHRNAKSFREHVKLRIDTTTVAEVAGEVIGFVMTHLDEIDQLYVDGRSRGTGIAGMLLHRGEANIKVGYPRAWLAVIAPNTRARRFYERNGWHDTGPFAHHAWTTAGASIRVPVRRYEKELTTIMPGRV